MDSKKELFKKILLDLADSDRFVSGIYNYCDRWCERCTMTSKCLSYAHEQEMKGDDDDPESNDIKNEKFWEQIRLSFEVTFELMAESAERWGIDLNNLPDVELPEHIERPVEELAKNYGYAMNDWLKENGDNLKQKTEQLLLIKNDEEDAVKFADAWEVVQWYGFFIAAKVHRAHFDLEKRQNEEDDEYNVFSDNLGSAKIAIIATERSMNALTAIYNDMKESEDEILKFLSQLSQIKKQMLATFPKVVDFKRPGFDE